MIGNKIADKITRISKKLAKELHDNNKTEEYVEITTHKTRYVSPEERQQIINELSWLLNNYWWFDINTYYKNGVPKNGKFVGQYIESTI